MPPGSAPTPADAGNWSCTRDKDKSRLVFVELCIRAANATGTQGQVGYEKGSLMDPLYGGSLYVRRRHNRACPVRYEYELYEKGK